ncbi:MAG: Fic family protein [Candidatus Acidiferrum sp.]
MAWRGARGRRGCVDRIKPGRTSRLEVGGHRLQKTSLNVVRTVWHNEIIDTKTEHRAAAVPLLPNAIAELKRHHEENPRTTWVFEGWIGSADSSRETARYVPPPEAVPRLVDEWLEWWHEQHRALRGQPKEDVVAGLAELHHRFLTIHPFMDGNGRVARSITDQAARELMNQGIGREFVEDAEAYSGALAPADGGDFKPLRERIKAALQ